MKTRMDKIVEAGERRQARKKMLKGAASALAGLARDLGKPHRDDEEGNAKLMEIALKGKGFFVEMEKMLIAAKELADAAKALKKDA